MTLQLVYPIVTLKARASALALIAGLLTATTVYTNAEPSSATELVAKESKAKYDLQADAKRMAGMSSAEAAWERTLEANLGSYYLPVYKNETLAGKPTAWDFVSDDPTLPRVLLIGDSISLGYTLAVRNNLEGIANLHRAPANCGPTAKGLQKLDSWLGDGNWDLIHFNFGIHDRFTNPSTYEKNLEALVARLKATGAKLVWANSTPLNGSPDKYPKGTMVEKNKIADAVMEKNGIPINDLYGLALPLVDKMQFGDGCHFQDAADERMGVAVARAVQNTLESR
jgi:lysophospholipase L1-like esterase